MRINERTASVLVALLTILCLAGAPVELRPQAPGRQTPGRQTLDATGQAALQQIINSGQDPELRWPNFQPYQAEVKDFCERPET